MNKFVWLCTPYLERWQMQPTPVDLSVNKALYRCRTAAVAHAKTNGHAFMIVSHARTMAAHQ